MNTNNPKKAAGASNSNGLHTDTNGTNFPTDGTPSKAITSPQVPTPNKAVTLATLTMRIDPVEVFWLRAKTPKRRKRIQAIHETMLGDFLVRTNDRTVYCKDLEAVQAFAQKLRMSK